MKVFLGEWESAVVGAWPCPSHRHGHFVVLIQPFLLVKGHFGIITVQLEGGRGKDERAGQDEPFRGLEAPLELGTSLDKPRAVPRV